MEADPRQLRALQNVHLVDEHHWKVFAMNSRIFSSIAFRRPRALSSAASSASVGFRRFASLRATEPNAAITGAKALFRAACASPYWSERSCHCAERAVG